MKIIKAMREKLAGIISALVRYPLTTGFLIAIAIVNGLAINDHSTNYTNYLLTLIVGAMISIVSQHLFERFFTIEYERILLMVATLTLTVIYYFTIGVPASFDLIISVKTAVIVFALLMAFIWIPSIRSEVTFNETFLATFKAFFITLLFSAVIAAGINLVIAATDVLLFSVDYKVYLHSLNIIGSLFTPLFFLSFTPNYLGKRDEGRSSEQLGAMQAEINKATGAPKNLTNLISYIIIPLVIAYTLILVIYISLNISGDFWSENLMEPLLVSYSIVAIIVYILVSNLNNKISQTFRKIFPKVLVLIVLFQTVASILKIGEMGVTHGRYYVIMFGIFALISGLIFSFMSVKRNGIIAIILLVFSLVSILPPIDAFTVSKANQIKLLETVLTKNEMLENNKIVPKDDIDIDDKIKISKTMSYLNSLQYLDDVNWLPKQFSMYNEFTNVFGFNETYDRERPHHNYEKYAHYNLNDNPALNIANYDYMTIMYISPAEDEAQTRLIETAAGLYKINQLNKNNETNLSLINEAGEELISMNVTKHLAGIFTNDENNDKQLTDKQATFTEDNERAQLNVVVESVNTYDKSYYANIYLFITIK